MVDIIDSWVPPTREHWALIAYIWQLYPFLAIGQVFTEFYPQGKTSIRSRLNIPGKWAWFLMELPSLVIVLFCSLTIPARLGLAPREGLPSLAALPYGNKAMLTLYTIHYLYRAVAAPIFLNPSMSPIHISAFSAAFVWQTLNAISIGGWIAGYGYTTAEEWQSQRDVNVIGLVMFSWGLLANVFHDEDLREIRYEVQRKKIVQNVAPIKSENGKSGIDKYYRVPFRGLFHWIFYAHFLCEWVEWAGFWLLGGFACFPARSFLLNEIASMLPRALQGKRWYESEFGNNAIGMRKAVIPYVL